MCKGLSDFCRTEYTSSVEWGVCEGMYFVVMNNDDRGVEVDEIALPTTGSQLCAMWVREHILSSFLYA